MELALAVLVDVASDSTFMKSNRALTILSFTRVHRAS
jgi:hypothetical protein